jgi:hypothetical protein
MRSAFRPPPNSVTSMPTTLLWNSQVGVKLRIGENNVIKPVGD